MAEQLTPWKKITSDPKFLGEADFSANEEKIATIDHVGQDMVQTQDGKEQKGIVYFRERDVKPMILNVTRGKAIAKVAGSRFIEKWPGTAIQLYIDENVKAFGTTVAAVRVRPKRPVIRQAILCSRCGGEVKPAMGKGADYIAAHTRKALGAVTCYECYVKAIKEAQAKQEAEKEGAEDGQTEADS